MGFGRNRDFAVNVAVDQMTGANVAGGPASTQLSSRTIRRAVAVGALAMVVIGVLLLYLLTQATNNREMYERNYTQLFTINVVVACLLLLSIAWVASRLWVRFRQGKFGSRLLVKLATIFALVGMAPGVLIYVVSYQFVSRSIEIWFDAKVEGALEAGLNLGRVTLDAMSVEVANKARAAAIQLSDNSEATVGVFLDRQLDPLGADELSVWGESGKLLASVSQSGFQLTPVKPQAGQFRLAKNELSAIWIEGLDDIALTSYGGARIKVLVPASSVKLGLAADVRYLLVTKTIPHNLVANALAVESANREYQERALGRLGLKRMYIGTLTLSLFLAVFGAILLAVILGNQIVRPLLLLAEGVSQVAAGDLTPKLAMQGKDELGGLTRSFASMTEQLADARQAVQRSMQQVDAARAHLQTILDNLTAGVMVLGIQGEIHSSNPGAERILNVSVREQKGQLLSNIPGLQEFGRAVQHQFADFLTLRNEHGLDHWQQTFELGGASGGAQNPFERSVTLVARGAELPGNQRLLVFDDISEIVSAQRAQAWGEVARRLAHEIKNPLTPIQLSAERLGLKLTGKLGDVDQTMLNKSVKTIVEQVEAMKRLVNEFRDYARLPAADLRPVDLNALVLDVVQLYESGSEVLMSLELDSSCPLVMGDGQQLRQVIHNLLQNAQDACESTQRGGERKVIVRTQWQRTTDRVRLSVIDSGTGFPEHILKRAFEPYVTTKAKGTGLGLAVVKKIADEHGSRIDVANRVVEGVVVGAQVSLSLAVEKSTLV